VDDVRADVRLSAARDRAAAAVVHAYGAGCLSDRACADLLDAVQRLDDPGALDQLAERVQQPATGWPAAVGGASPVQPGHRGAGGPTGVTRPLDAVDLALAARSTTARRPWGSDRRTVSLVAMVAVLVVLGIVGVILAVAVSRDLPPASPRGAGPVAVPGTSVPATTR
jgi:hypothetical protein